MAIIRTMYKKAESPILEDLKKLDRKRAERMIAARNLRIKESLNNPTKKAGLEPAN